MPKGGDLHTHLSGAVYAERFIAWAAQEASLRDPPHEPAVDAALRAAPGDAAVADAMRDQNLYDQLVNAFSMRFFLPTLALPSDHDQFFAAFGKFGAASGSHFVDMTIDQLKQYDSENVQYVEFMMTFCLPERSPSGSSRPWPSRMTMPRRLAGAAGERARSTASRRSATSLAAAIGKIRSELGCDQQATQPGCRVTFRYIAQICAIPPSTTCSFRLPSRRRSIRAEPQRRRAQSTFSPRII